MRILSSASSNLCLLLALIAYSTAPLQADREISLTNFTVSFDPVFATLLTQPEVQDELEISKSQSEELFAVLTKYRDEWRKHAETFTKQVETSAKLEAGKEPISLKNLRLMNQEYSEKILAILQPKQQGRFLEIYLRTRAKTDTASVLLFAIVRDKLKLADEQVEQLEKIQKKAISSNVKTFLDGRETVKGIKGTSIESLRELNKAVSRMQEKQQISIKDSSVEALKVLNEEQKTTFEKIQGPAVPIKIAENSIDKDAELIKLNKTIDSVEQMIQIWKTAPLTELEQVYSVLLQGAKLTDEKRNAQVKQFENQLKQNQEKRLQLTRMDNSITSKIAGNPSKKNRKENPDKDDVGLLEALKNPVPQVDESDLIGPVFTKNEAKIAQKVLAGILKSPIEGHIKLSDKTQMNMVLIPAGKTIFGTGNNGSEDFKEIDILFPFYMGKFEVTVDQFSTFALETGYKTNAEKSKYGHGFNKVLNKFIDGVSRSEGDGNDFYWGYTGFELHGSSPVVNLTVNDMNAFVLWLRKKTGLYVDFPTPREWTYAAKAGVGTKYNWGDEFQNFEKHANLRPHGADNGLKVLTPVGSYEPNAFGLHDVLGNVWEICKNNEAKPDWYYSMGGSFFSKQKCCQLGHYHGINRNYPENALNLHSYEIGFRLIIRLSDNKN